MSCLVVCVFLLFIHERTEALCDTVSLSRVLHLFCLELVKLASSRVEMSTIPYHTFPCTAVKPFSRLELGLAWQNLNYLPRFESPSSAPSSPPHDCLWMPTNVLWRATPLTGMLLH